MKKKNFQIIQLSSKNYPEITENIGNHKALIFSQFSRNVGFDKRKPHTAASKIRILRWKHISSRPGKSNPGISE
jgi:hypothetical protein